MGNAASGEGDARAAAAAAEAAEEEEEFGNADPNVLNSLVAEGLRPDMALLPYQMPRAANYVARSAETSTVTIVNRVNLAKGTLAVVRDEGGLHGVTFEYHAERPFTVVVHFGVHEVQDERKAPERFEAPPGRGGRVAREYRLPAGRGTFLQAPDDMVDLGAAGAMLEHAEGTLDFPVVVVLTPAGGEAEEVEEVVLAEGKDEEKGDDGNEGGGQRAASAELTYASLSDDGGAAAAAAASGSGAARFKAKVIRQVLLVDGFPFDVEEIFGLEDGGGSGGGSGGGQGDRTADCVVCLTEPRDTTILPCRHMCVCHECAATISRGTNLCPVCRSYAHSLFRLEGTAAVAAAAAAAAAAGGAAAAAAGGAAEDGGEDEQLPQGKEKERGQQEEEARGAANGEVAVEIRPDEDGEVARP